jgi:hypothetical protein
MLCNKWHGRRDELCGEWLYACISDIPSWYKQGYKRVAQFESGYIFTVVVPHDAFKRTCSEVDKNPLREQSYRGQQLFLSSTFLNKRDASDRRDAVSNTSKQLLHPPGTEARVRLLARTSFRLPQSINRIPVADTCLRHRGSYHHLNPRAKR